MKIINIDNLTKDYRRKKNRDNGIKGTLADLVHPEYDIIRAVNNVSFSVEEGQAVGCIGPNGSGKSTLIKMLTGILTPTSGEVQVFGKNPAKDKINNNRKIGVVMGNRSSLYWDVPVIESFRMLQIMYEIPSSVYERNLALFTEMMNLNDLLSVPERQLSLGQRVRCNIAAAFLHDPRIVYLDEPTIGLDTDSKQQIRKFISRINAQQKVTFIITSHDFQDIEMLCNRIVLLNRGELLLDEEINRIRNRFEKQKRIKFLVDSNQRLRNKKIAIGNAAIVFEDSCSVEIEYEAKHLNPVEIINYISDHCEILDVSISGQSIESIIYDIIQNDKRNVL